MIALAGIGSARAATVETADAPARGRALFSQHCASCHGDGLEGGVAPPLAGPAFVRTWSASTRTVDDLYYVMRTSMPRPAAGSLSESQYLDLLAFLLARNGVAIGAEPLTAEPARLATLRVPAAAGGDASAGIAKQEFIRGTGAATPAGRGPSAAELLAAEGSTDWPYHTHDLRGTRHAPLAQINRGNVRRLQVACLYQMGSTETFVTGPIEYRGTLYVTTARLTAAIDAATCRERWQHKWVPQDTEIWGNNRGVAIEDGYVVRGTADGYLLALDAADGRLLWARQVARPAASETITLPPLIVGDLVIVGPAGSENAVQGWVGAFRLADGSPVWRFNTLPRPGEPGYETWTHDPAVPVAGAAVWSPLAFDAVRGELYVPVTNPAPDFPAALRPGTNLYTNSLLALDVRSGAYRWHVQVRQKDDKDWDLTQVSPLIEARVDGRERRLVVASGKDGIVRVLDRDSHAVLHQTVLGTRLNEDAAISREGTHYCPGMFGGIQWNGPAWLPATQALYVPSVDWCSTATLDEVLRPPSPAGYLGGSFRMDAASQGFLSAIDLASGRIRWQYRSAKPMVAGVTTTDGGLVFAGELTGDLIALDAHSGAVLYRFNTGGPMTGGVISYAVAGRQYVGVASGRGSLAFGDAKGAPTVVVFSLPAP